VSQLPAAIAEDGSWRRLSPRMLLIHPVREVGRFIPALAGLLLAGHSAGHDWWSLAALVLVMVLSVLRWFTTSYQITPAQVQVRTGLLRRRTLTTPTDRVRTVDVTAHALHRVLGLARVVIGTGSSDRKKEGLVLDGLAAPAAAALRAELLHRGATGPLGPAAVAGPGGGDDEQLLAVLDPSWVRFAPFTLSGVVSALAIVGVGWRAISQTNVDANRVGAIRSATDHLRHTAVWLDVIQVGLLALLVVVLLSVVGYVLAFWNFRLTRHRGGTLHIARGLITSRATSISEHRLRGVELSQLLPLRGVHGARLQAITTGLRVGRGAERGGTLLLPACPEAAAVRTAAAVLPAVGPALRAELDRHGSRARYRRLVRATVPASGGWLLLLLWWWAGSLPVGWLLAGLVLPGAGVWLGHDRYRQLGHQLVPGYLISQWGAANRRRVVLATDGIIGWNLQQSFFQRRAGLLSLHATTAAGRQSYPVSDLDPAAAVRLADAACPGLLSQFLVSGEGKS